jgi:glutathione S-transferase
MYVPIVLRLKTYQITLSPEAQQYCDFVMRCPVLQVWITQALTETDIVECDEAGTPL